MYLYSIIWQMLVPAYVSGGTLHNGLVMKNEYYMVPTQLLGSGEFSTH